MNRHNPSPLTRTNDAALNEARAALAGLTGHQAAVTIAAVLRRKGLLASGDLAAEAMIVKALPDSCQRSHPFVLPEARDG